MLVFGDIMVGKKLAYSGKQDKLWDRKFRMRDGTYREIEGGLIVEIRNEASCGRVTVTDEQDRLFLSKVRVSEGRWGTTYYSVWNPSMAHNGKDGIFRIID